MVLILCFIYFVFQLGVLPFSSFSNARSSVISKKLIIPAKVSNIGFHSYHAIFAWVAVFFSMINSFGNQLVLC